MLTSLIGRRRLCDPEGNIGEVEFERVMRQNLTVYMQVPTLLCFASDLFILLGEMIRRIEFFHLAEKSGLWSMYSALSCTIGSFELMHVCLNADGLVRDCGESDRRRLRSSWCTQDAAGLSDKGTCLCKNDYPNKFLCFEVWMHAKSCV
jgi:hypothetical protein